MRALYAVVLFAACGRPVEVPEAPAPARAPAPAAREVTLSLETRDGMGSQGWSFATGGQVPLSEADLHVASFDCGARGRWVTLEGSAGVQLCTAAGCMRGLPAGGTDEVFRGDFEVRRGDTVLATARIVRESPTPRDWYAQSPMPPFEVVLAF